MHRGLIGYLESFLQKPQELPPQRDIANNNSDSLSQRVAAKAGERTQLFGETQHQEINWGHIRPSNAIAICDSIPQQRPSAEVQKQLDTFPSDQRTTQQLTAQDHKAAANNGQKINASGPSTSPLDPTKYATSLVVESKKSRPQNVAEEELVRLKMLTSSQEKVADAGQRQQGLRDIAEQVSILERFVISAKRKANRVVV